MMCTCAIASGGAGCAGFDDEGAVHQGSAGGTAGNFIDVQKVRGLASYSLLGGKDL